MIPPYRALTPTEQELGLYAFATLPRWQEWLLRRIEQIDVRSAPIDAKGVDEIAAVARGRSDPHQRVVARDDATAIPPVDTQNVEMLWRGPAAHQGQGS